MIYMFLANGFEEVEALCPLDLLRRAGLDVKTVGIGSKLITGAHNITVEADITDTELEEPRPDMIILPGGMPGTTNLGSSHVVDAAICSALKDNTYIAAICAAPMILGKRGILNGKRAICYPGFEQYLDSATLAEEKVVVDGRIITAAGMGVALDFGLTLVSLLAGEETAAKIRSAIIAK